MVHLDQAVNSGAAGEAANGVVTIACAHSVEQAAAKLEEILRAKGVKLFAVVDHSGEAEAVGLAMPSTKLLIFGNSKAGTPIMVATPLAAMDLPLKVLIWEDLGGKVWVSYNTPAYLRARHGFPAELMGNLAAVGALAAAAAAE